VKRIFICIAAIVIASGALQASGIIACSGVANSSNSCYTSHLSTFDLQLNWDTSLSTSSSIYTAPVVNGTPASATWYASAGYVNVDITGTSLIRAYDYAMLNNTTRGYQSIPGFGPYKFTGTFDSGPDSGLTTSGVGITIHSFNVPSVSATGAGESLLGSYNAGSFVIGTTAVLSSFGFRIAAISSATFNVTINLFGSTDGSGTALQTLTLSALSGGGNCQSLSVLTNGNPTTCNTAPFIYVNTTGNVRSFSIATSDPTGFYIDALDFNAVPEPATMLITGGGLVTLAWFLRRKRAATARP
jgi:hypothetical protein